MKEKTLFFTPIAVLVIVINNALHGMDLVKNLVKFEVELIALHNIVQERMNILRI